MVSASKLASERVQLDLLKLTLSFAPQGEHVSIFTLPVEMSTPAPTCARASRSGTLNNNAWTTRTVRTFFLDTMSRALHCGPVFSRLELPVSRSEAHLTFLSDAPSTARVSFTAQCLVRPTKGKKSEQRA